jgi:hypothetical protein
MAFVARRLFPLVFLALLWTPAAYAWSWPVQGPVLQKFSFDRAHPYAAGQHRGIDIGAAAGTTLVAPAGGTVTFSGSVPTSGESLTILEPDGYSVTLTHLGTIAVARGATVTEGEPVGTVGPSGTPELDTPYVHLGVRVASDANGYVDPLSLLPPVAAPPPPTPPPPSASAGSAAPPAQTTPASPVVPASPVAASSAPAPVAIVPAPDLSEARDPAVPRRHVPTSVPVAAKPAARPAARPATEVNRPAQPARPEPARPQPRLQSPRPPVVQSDAGDAHPGRQPQPVAEISTQAPHRPVQVPLPMPASAPPRELPAVREPRFPFVPLALGAGAATLALVAVGGVLRLRRRCVLPAPPEASAVVIPLPRRAAPVEEARRVA